MVNRIKCSMQLLTPTYTLEYIKTPEENHHEALLIYWYWQTIKYAHRKSNTPYLRNYKSLLHPPTLPLFSTL